jgi:hypothetical protein
MPEAFGGRSGDSLADDLVSLLHIAFLALAAVGLMLLVLGSWRRRVLKGHPGCDELRQSVRRATERDGHLGANRE